MAVTLNKAALEHARSLIKSGDFVADERDDWSEHAPSARTENSYIKEHEFADYGRWYLGVDKGAGEDTKARYSFPFGDFKKVHRCGVISLETRAAQFDHTSIARAAKQLLEAIDAAN